MKTYKLIVRKQKPKNNDEGKQEHLLVARGKGGMLAIPCYRIETEIISKGLTFDGAKELRKDYKGSEIMPD
jgi:hypothetical protein